MKISKEELVWRNYRAMEQLLKNKDKEIKELKKALKASNQKDKK